MIKTLITIATALVLTACGGGGGDSPVAVDSNLPKTEYIQVNFNTVFQQKMPLDVVSTFRDEKNKIIIVSDEPYWNWIAATGDRFINASNSARQMGYRSAVAFTPYATDARVFNILKTQTENEGGIFLGKLVTEEMYMEMAKHVDIIAINPYFWGSHLLDVAYLKAWTDKWVKYAHSVGKPIMIITYGLNNGGSKELAASHAKAGADYITVFRYLDGVSDEERLMPQHIANEWDAVPTIKENLGNVQPYTKAPAAIAKLCGLVTASAPVGVVDAPATSIASLSDGGRVTTLPDAPALNICN